MTPANAVANGTITNLNPTAGVNQGAAATTISFTTTNTFVMVNPEPTVTFKRKGAPTDTFTADIPDPDPAAPPNTAPGKQFTVKAALANRNPGVWTIEVTGQVVNDDPDDDPKTNDATVQVMDSCVDCFTIVGYAPTVSGVAPSTIGQGTTGKLVVNGSNFTTTAYCVSTAENCTNQPRLYVVPDTGLTFTDNAVGTGSQMTRAFSVAANAPTGARDVYVANTDGKTAKCTGCLTIAPPPNLTPNALGPAMTAARNVVISGLSFPASGTVAKIVLPNGNDDGTNSANITSGTTTRNSATQLTLPVQVNSGAATGSRGLRITEGGGEQLFPNAFAVTARPKITAVSYPSGTATGYGQGAQSRVLRLTGTGFQTGATVAFAPAIGITQVGAPVVNQAGTEIDVTLSLAPAGATDAPATTTAKSITVTNPDGGVSDTTPEPDLTVLVGPKIEDVQPRSLARGATNTLKITGTDFTLANSDVTVLVPGADVGPEVVTTEGTKRVIYVDVTIPANAAIGALPITVLNNPDKGQSSPYTGFSVTNMAVSSVSPSTVANELQTVAVGGSGFAPDAKVTLYRNDIAVDEIPATQNVVNAGGTRIDATLPLHLAAPGKWNIRVDNPTTNPGTGNCECQLTVVAPAASLTSVLPASRGLGADNEKIEIVGTGFTPGMKVEFDDKARIQIDATKTVVTPTKVTIFIDITGTYGANEDPAVRMDKVHVKMADNTLVGSKDFDVTRPPDATQAAGVVAERSQGTTGGTFKVLVDQVGTNSGAKLLVGGEGVTVGSTTYDGLDPQGQDSTAELIATNVSVAANAAPGVRDVYVRNPDGGRDKCACTFVVSTPPTVSGISPAKGARGRTTPFTLSGTGFQQGASVTVGGVTASSVIVTSPTQLQGSVAIPGGMLLGMHDVTITNVDNGSGTKAGIFKVFTLPGAPTGVTAQRGNASATVSWTPPVSDGGDPLTGFTVMSNPATTPVTAAGNATSVTFPGLTNGVSYTFTVVATNAAGNGPASAPSAPVVVAAPPSAPTNVAATAGDGSATVTWTPSASNGGLPITGYKVTSDPHGKTATVPASQSEAVVTGLTNATSYTFTVVGINDAGESAPSAPSAAVTPRTVMGAPTDLHAVAGDGKATVAWSPGNANGGTPLTGYIVKSSPGGHTTEVGPTVSSAVVNGLTNGTTYTFTVAAQNAAGDTAESAPSNAVTPAGAPLAPAAVTATAGHAAARVAWAAANANGSPVTSYTVTVSPGGDTKTVSGTSTATTISGLTNGTLYTFSVKAKNAIGTGPAKTSNAVRPTWVTTLTEAATSRLVSGGVATVRGRLTRADGAGLAGATVQIYRRVSPATTYTLAKTVTTKADGTWSTTFTLVRNTRFQARFLGAPAYDAAVSPIRVSAVAYKVTGTYRISGRTVTVTGAISPNAAGRAVYLRHRRSNGTYVNIRSAYVRGDGTYRLSRTLPRGTYNLYVYITGSTTNVAGRTPVRVTRLS